MKFRAGLSVAFSALGACGGSTVDAVIPTGGTDAVLAGSPCSTAAHAAGFELAHPDTPSALSLQAFLTDDVRSEPVGLCPGDVLLASDRFALTFEATESVSVFVLAIDGAGVVERLSAAPRRLDPGERMSLPDEVNAYRLTDATAIELVVLVRRPGADAEDDIVTSAASRAAEGTSSAEQLRRLRRGTAYVDPHSARVLVSPDAAGSAVVRFPLVVGRTRSRSVSLDDDPT